MSLLRTLLIIAIIYLAIRFIGRFVFPYLVKKVVNKAQENMEERYRKQEEGNDGEISIKHKSRDKNRNDKDDGEYVDYEEVK